MPARGTADEQRFATMRPVGHQCREEGETMGADGGVETPRRWLEDAWTGAQKGSRHGGSAKGESLREGAIDHLRGGRFEELRR